MSIYKQKLNEVNMNIVTDFLISFPNVESFLYTILADSNESSMTLKVALQSLQAHRLTHHLDYSLKIV